MVGQEIQFEDIFSAIGNSRVTESLVDQRKERRF